jgi:alpha-D-xyloside xylohydrolase
MTALDRQLPRFLGRSIPVDLAVSATTSVRHPAIDRSTTEMIVDTIRVQPGDRAAYGTIVEVPNAPVEAGPPLRLRIDHLTAQSSRVRLGRGGFTDRTSLFLDTQRTASDGPVSIHESPLSVDLAGRLRTRTWHIDSLERMGESTWPRHEQAWQILHRFGYPLGIAADGSCAFATFDLAHDASVYGWGEDFGPLDKRGRSRVLWMQEAFTNNSSAHYKPIPFVWSPSGWGLIVHTTHATRIDVAASDHTAMSVVVDDADELDLVLIAGDTPADILREYAELTGAPRVPPRWSFGMWQGRISYASQAEVLDVAQQLRERRIPCDVIHIDTNWFADDWACDYRFDPARFPDPAQMLSTLREQGFRVCLWQWPNAMQGTATFDDGATQGWLVTDASGKPYVQEESSTTRTPLRLIGSHGSSDRCWNLACRQSRPTSAKALRPTAPTTTSMQWQCTTPIPSCTTAPS